MYVLYIYIDVIYLWILHVYVCAHAIEIVRVLPDESREIQASWVDPVVLL